VGDVESLWIDRTEEGHGVFDFFELTDSGLTEAKLGCAECRRAEGWYRCCTVSIYGRRSGRWRWSS
jgi:hypothetical protein